MVVAKLKAFPDDKINFGRMMISVFDRKHYGKMSIFSFFYHVLDTSSSQGSVKFEFVWYSVQLALYDHFASLDFLLWSFVHICVQVYDSLNKKLQYFVASRQKKRKKRNSIAKEIHIRIYLFLSLLFDCTLR